MNSIINKMNNTFIKTALIAASFVFSFLAAGSAWAVAPEFTVRNVTNPTFSAGGTATPPLYAASTRAKPGDVLEFQMFTNTFSAAAIIITLPADLTYVTTVSSSPTATPSANGQTITWTFASGGTNRFVRFRTSVVSGASLSASHTLNINYTTDTAFTSGTATIQTGPVIKSITPNTGSSSAVAVTLKGHGFKQTSDILSPGGIVLSPGNIDIVQPGMSVSGPDGDGLYTITGLRVPAGTAVGTYYVILTTSGFDGVAFPLSNTLSTEANTSETAVYIVDTGKPTITSYSASQTGNDPDKAKAGAVVFTAAFDEALNVVPKIAINQPGTTDISATDMTSAGGNTYTYTYTVQSATGGTYVDGSATVTISGAADLAGNVMTSVDHTLTFDTTKPTVQSFAIAQGINTAGTVKAGVATITIVMSETVTTVPKIAINQPGTTDISATDMTSAGGNTYTYTYTVQSATGGTYVDGATTVTISIAADSFGNVMNADSSHTFTINTVSPFVANFTVTQGANTSGYVKAGAASISITMSETVTTTPKIALNQPGTTDISATDMTSAGGNAYTFAYIVVAPNGGTYLDGTATVTISAAATDIGNTMSDSLHTFVIDNAKPTVSLFSITQGSNTSGSVKAGNAIIAITANETLSIAPKIAIAQQGSESISATDMTLSSGNTFVYTYAVNSATGGTYIDGTATTTISLAADRAGNVMNSSNFEFVIDTVTAAPAITDLAVVVVDNSTITLSFTPGALEPDFGQFKAYYAFFSGVNSENGTVASSAVSLFQVAGLSAGRTYYFVVYACDTADNCSEASNEASARVFSYAVSLSKGWNLVSFPVDPAVGGAAAAISDVFASVPAVSAVWSYRSQNGEWLAYWPSNPDQSTLSAVEAGYGYWVQYADDAPFVFFGYGELFLEGPNAPPSAELSAGWNLIGYYQRQDTTSVPVSYALRNNLYNLSTLDPLWSQLLKYDTLANNFIELNAASLINPGTGYWILMPGAGSDRYIYTLGATP